jgi:hypothetical protein
MQTNLCEPLVSWQSKASEWRGVDAAVGLDGWRQKRNLLSQIETTEEVFEPGFVAQRHVAVGQ